MVKETYLINEAAKEVHVEAHVLRYWEEELGLPIKRNPQGHRIYTQEDIDRFIKIKDLKDKGMQLKAVKAFLPDNPFEQRQPAKASKALKEEEAYAGSEYDIPRGPRREEAFGNKKKMIEIKSIKSVMKPKNEITEAAEARAQTPEQTQRLQYLFQKLVRDAVAENNEEMINKIIGRISESIREDLCKELDYQFRLFEERDDERATSRMSAEDKRNEEYYKRIDELLSRYRGKKFSKKDKDKEKEENTISFPLAEKEKEKEKEAKPKKEFRLFKKAAEAKFF